MVSTVIMLLLPLLFILQAVLGADTVADLTARGDKFRAAGKFNDALAEYSKAVRLDPGNYLVLFKRGAVYMGMDGKELAAIADFGKVLGVRPGFEGALMQRGKLQLKLGRFEEAKKDAKDMKKGDKLVKDVELAEEKMEKATEAFKAGQWEECEQLATDGIRVAAASPQLHSVREQCNIKKGNIRGALVDLSSLESYGVKQVRFDAYVKSAKLLYYVFHEYDKALSHLQRCLQFDMDNKNCQTMFQQIRQLEKKGGGSYSGLPGLEKPYPSAHKIWKEVVAFATSDKLELLKTAVKTAYTELDLGSTEPESHSSVLTGLDESICMAYYNEKQYKNPTAVQYCAKVVSREHVNSPAIRAEIAAHMLTVEGLLQQDDFDGAIAEVNRALEVHADNNQLKQKLQEIQMLAARAKAKDYYKVLGLSRTADDREIRSAYREMSRQYHPDKYRGEMTPEQVDRKMAEVNEAYEVLSTPELKERFDRGDDPNSKEPGFGAGAGSPFQHQFQHGAGGGNPFGGFGGGGSQEDILKMFMRQHMQQQQQQQQHHRQHRQHGGQRRRQRGHHRG